MAVLIVVEVWLMVLWDNSTKEKADCNAAISRDPGNKQMYLKLHARAFR
ncbi:MAG: hypothetical protein R3F51_18995 [Cyanobacteriota/Melainabacteria group bacterium]